MTIRTQLKAGKIATNHNETLQVRTGLQGGKLRKRLVTTSPKEDRLTLLVVRAGLRAGRDARGARSTYSPSSLHRCRHGSAGSGLPEILFPIEPGRYAADYPNG